MKRPFEEEDTESEPATSKPKLETDEDTAKETIILQKLQENLKKGNLNDHISTRICETEKRYFTVYMEKLINKLPLGKDLANIIAEKAGANEFEYMFTAAKSVIQSQIRVKQIKTFHAVFDMVYGLVWRYVHKNIISPTLVNHQIVSAKQLQLAYENYQNCSKTEEDASTMELQCLLYCIQEMLENQESVKIPNPYYSRLTQQMKAISEYVITLLVSMSKPETSSTDFNIIEEVVN